MSLLFVLDLGSSLAGNDSNLMLSFIAEAAVLRNHEIGFSIFQFYKYITNIKDPKSTKVNWDLAGNPISTAFSFKMKDDEYNLIIMATPYDRILKRGVEGQPVKKKNIGYKANLHRISFQDSDDSSRIDIPNIFLDDRENTEDIVYSPVKPRKKESPVVEKQDSFQQFRQTKSPSKRIQAIYNQPEPEPQLQEEVAEPESDMEPHSSLSMLEVVKLNLGEFLFRDQYPLSKTIYINNNNDEQNELNQKEYLMKNKNDRELLHFSNSLEVGTVLFFLALFLRNIFGYLYIYAWLAIIILQFLAESLIFHMPIQYGTDKVSMIVLLILAIVIQMVSDWLSFRKRRSWQDDQSTYKLYHHNGHVAEWVNTKASEIKPGNVFRLSPGQQFPTDCLLVHGENSMIKIDETQILSQLVEHPSEITLKETLIKQQNSPLPLSGFVVYEVSGPEYTDFQIVGKLNLEEPQKNSHSVSISNIALRGSLNVSDIEITCLALETGIDSLFLKSIQYPFSQRKQFQFSTPFKRRNISSEVSQEIKEYEGTLLGCNLQKKVESVIFTLILLYFLITALGVLAKFAFGLTTANEFFLSQGQIEIWKVAIYHATNYIIMIPVLLLPMFKMFLVLAGTLSESNISKRAIEISAETDRHKRASSLMESVSSKNQELLDNKKIVFPLQVKDYNLMTELCKVDTIITTIDTFRDHSAFTLHSIRVKDISHNLMTNSIDNQAYGVSDQETLKQFMSVALLTSTRKQYDYRTNQPTSYDSGIEYAAKKYFDLQKNKNAKGQTIIGNGTFVVKELFHIDPVYEFPYKLVFLETSSEEGEENTRVLVLIRGNAKVILDKCYGKEVKFSEESRKLEEQKGFHVELLAKLTLHVIDAMEIKKAFLSPAFEKTLFYKNLDKYISKVESMGLLVFVNQFHQKKIGESLKNPILNKSIINVPGARTSSRFSDNITSSMMPNVIILAPLSKSSQPEFQSIHTITNLLISPYLFHLSLTEVGDKIYHQKPSDLDKMFDHLDEQRILVWNGWDQKDITYTVDVMKLYGRNILFYTQKDEYMYLMKQTSFAVKGGEKGYDAAKYSDINLTSKCSISYLYLLQLIKYDSVAIRQGALNILMTQVGKCVLYLVIETVNIFYTRGTALIIIKSPLFLVIEGVLFFDVFYYLNWKDSARVSSFNKKASFFREVGLLILTKIVQGLFVTLLCFYSTQTPSSSTGTTHPYQYTYFAITFVIAHLLIFQKALSILGQSLSVYKAVIITGQVVFIYIGFIVVSVMDKYCYKGVLWSALAAGNIAVTAIACIWICLTVPAVRLLFNIMKSRGLRSKQAKKVQ